MAVQIYAQVSVTKTFARFSQPGFGVPLIASYHTRTGNLVDTYSSLTEMVDDGFATTDHAYKMASALLSQNSVVPRFKVGRLENAHTHTIDITPANTTEGFVYNLTFKIGSVTETLSVTVQSGDAVADICDDLVTAHGAATALAAVTSITDNSTKVTIDVDTDGDVMEVTTTNNPADLQIADVTADSSLADDLTAINDADEDWYCLLLDVASDARIAAARSWVDSNGGNSAARPKVALYECFDSAIVDEPSTSTTDPASDLATAATDRNAVVYGAGVCTSSHCALAGDRLPADPGSSTWGFKRLVGQTPPNLTRTQLNAALGKSANVFAQFGSTGSTNLQGTMGSGEFIDITRGLDWFKSQIETALGTLLVASPKIPFTQAGLDVVKGTLEAVQQAAVTQGVLDAGDPEDPDQPVPRVIMPSLGSTTAADRAARILRGVEVTGRLSGAIHTFVIAVKVSI